MSPLDLLDVLEDLITSTVAPAAPDVDATGAFPSASMDALSAAGLLGVMSATGVGGAGLGLAEAASVVRRLAAACGSTAMVTCMHYCGTAVLEAHGPDDIRRAIADGRHLTTLAFSERSSRSHFWAPLSSATVDGDGVRLDAEKSWVTAAGHADSYVWTSRPTAAPGGATLWLVPAGTDGLTVAPAFDGLGLRGNDSRPITAVAAALPASARLGADGGGLDIALGVVLPVFTILSASGSLGLCDALLAKTIAHATTARFEHLDESLAQQPVARRHVATMQRTADAASMLVADAIDALSAGRDDAPLRMLEAKAVAAEAALAVGATAMRVGGGAAFRKDIGIERHFRDAQASAVMAPTTDALDDFVGRAICGLPLFD